MKIAIQGLESSFHAIAAERIYGNSIHLVYCETFKEVFLALKNKRADHAVVAIENSLYGSINAVYDLLLQYDFWINAEVYEQISLHLLATPGTTLKSINDVYSQAPALAEAESFLDEKLPYAERHEHSDTALAAKEVAQWKNVNRAAIASAAAAKTYNLEIISSNIETHHHNYTRFLALSRTREDSDRASKTSITFQTKDSPGSLYAVLGVFAKRNINLSKLESRPIVGSAWRYMYYADFEATPDNELISELKNCTKNLRILGSYVRGEVTVA